jgi:hypothetical protein
MQTSCRTASLCSLRTTACTCQTVSLSSSSSRRTSTVPQALQQQLVVCRQLLSMKQHSSINITSSYSSSLGSCQRLCSGGTRTSLRQQQRCSRSSPTRCSKLLLLVLRSLAGMTLLQRLQAQQAWCLRRSQLCLMQRTA